ncbi:MAG: hypothetical protein SGILL_000840 [Bacillariaceae sp.]
MSVTDVIVSSAFFMSTWAIPKDSYVEIFPVYGNVGTVATCNAQGFFLQLGVMLPMYNALLVLYYFVTIRMGWNEQRFQKRVEPFGHAFIWTFGIATATTALVMELFGDAMGWCWIAENGTREIHMYRFLFWYVPLWLVFPWVVLGMSVVYFHVLKNDKKLEKYLRPFTQGDNQNHSNSAVGGSANDNITVTPPIQPSSPNSAKKSRVPFGTVSVSKLPHSPRCSVFGGSMRSSCGAKSIQSQQSKRTVASLRRSARKRSNAVAAQGVLYVLAFVLVYLWPTITRSMQVAGHLVPFPIYALFFFMLPLQGFLNCLVFFRPRVLTHLRERRRRHERAQRQEQASLQQQDLQGNLANILSIEKKNQCETEDRTDRTDQASDVHDGLEAA